MLKETSEGPWLNGISTKTETRKEEGCSLQAVLLGDLLKINETELFPTKGQQREINTKTADSYNVWVLS